MNIPNILLSQLGEINDIVSLYTDFQIKDEKIVMYGFLTAELNMFRLLQSIQDWTESLPINIVCP